MVKSEKNQQKAGVTKLGHKKTFSFNDKMTQKALQNRSNQVTPISDGKKLSESLCENTPIKALNGHENEEYDVKDLPRRDRFGKLIIGGGKSRHKISFMDRIVPGAHLEQVFYVESYKKYNLQNDDDDAKYKNYPCQCSIF